MYWKNKEIEKLRQSKPKEISNFFNKKKKNTSVESVVPNFHDCFSGLQNDMKTADNAEVLFW